MIAFVTNLAMTALIGSQFFPSLREKLGIAFVLTLLLAPFSIPFGIAHVRRLRKSRLQDPHLTRKDALKELVKGCVLICVIFFWVVFLDQPRPLGLISLLAIPTAAIAWSCRRIADFFPYY